MGPADVRVHKDQGTGEDFQGCTVLQGAYSHVVSLNHYFVFQVYSVNLKN